MRLCVCMYVCVGRGGWVGEGGGRHVYLSVCLSVRLSVSLRLCVSVSVCLIDSELIYVHLRLCVRLSFGVYLHERVSVCGRTPARAV